MAETSIQWTDRSINPIRFRDNAGRVGHFCQKISPGCAHCYASGLQRRFRTPEFRGESSEPEGKVFLDEGKLQEVLRRRKPTRYFWCEMTDLFGHWVPDEWLDKCFTTMALTPQHTHQVLTKRPERMRDYFAGFRESAMMGDSISIRFKDMPDGGTLIWPLPNVWLGVSVEDQRRADERIPLLLQTPAAVRFLSVEPLLGPVDLGPWLGPWTCDLHNGKNGPTSYCGSICRDYSPHGKSRGPLDWIIVGGESGPNSRPFDLAWARSIHDQCKTAGVPFFFNQAGANAVTNDDGDARHAKSGTRYALGTVLFQDKKGGDPEEWPEDLRVREFPAVSH